MLITLHLWMSQVNYCPCYEHATLADLIDHAGLSWRYYAWHKPKSIWNAPYSIYHLCQPDHAGGDCTGSHFTGSNPDVTTTEQQILTDLDPSHCDLKNMVWVMPDGNWSDHPGRSATKKGPVWVSRIVNKIGTTTCNDNGVPYWKNTLILITWDDWGGFYDHVKPYKVERNPNNWGSVFVSGFRVPLLVVSAYTDQHTISGVGGSEDHCLDQNVFYCHDFGSILAFIEHNFGLLGVGSLDGGVHYADDSAPDNKGTNVPLSEFFNLSVSSPRTFQQITLPNDAPAESYFINYTGEVPPDNDN